MGTPTARSFWVGANSECFPDFFRSVAETILHVRALIPVRGSRDELFDYSEDRDDSERWVDNELPWDDESSAEPDG